MRFLVSSTRFFAFGSSLLISCFLGAAGPTSSPSSSKPSVSTKPQLQLPPRQETSPQQPHKPLAKPELPPMLKPFEMPGVIGLTNDKWEGTDYLGYLSKNIGIDVEIVKTTNIPGVPDSSSIESRIADVFSKENIIPRAEVTEGPPLPFFHVMIMIYQVDKDRYVIVGNGRLFEQIQVIRKDFIPAGYWQGITWENQDTALVNEQQMSNKIIEIAEKLATAFAKRYRQYNFSKEAFPGSESTPLLPS